MIFQRIVMISSRQSNVRHSDTADFRAVFGRTEAAACRPSLKANGVRALVQAPEPY